MATFKRDIYELKMEIWERERTTIYTKAHDDLSLKSYIAKNRKPKGERKPDKFWLLILIMPFFIAALLTGIIFLLDVLFGFSLGFKGLGTVYFNITLGFMALFYLGMPIMMLDGKIWDYWFYLNRMEGHRSESAKNSLTALVVIIVLCWVVGWYNSLISKKLAIVIGIIAYLIWRRVSFGNEKRKYYELYVPKPQVEDYISD